MLNNFIYAKTKDLFLEALDAGRVPDEAIVFIEDTKEVGNHGHYFAGESCRSTISEFRDCGEGKLLPLFIRTFLK